MKRGVIFLSVFTLIMGLLPLCQGKSNVEPLGEWGFEGLLEWNEYSPYHESGPALELEVWIQYWPISASIYVYFYNYDKTQILKTLYYTNGHGYGYYDFYPYVVYWLQIWYHKYQPDYGTLDYTGYTRSIGPP